METALYDMTPDLLPEVAALWHAGWHDGHASVVPTKLTQLRTHDSFYKRMSGLVSDTRVALRGADVVGFVTVQHDEVYQMYVAPAGRGSGVASQLLQDAEARIAKDFKTAWLSCAIGNTRAASFYTKSGWTHTRNEEVPLTTSAGPFMLRVWRFEKPLV